MANLLEIKDLEKSYLQVGTNFKGARNKILNGVNLSITAGSCVGLIGESGSGKSTLARLVMGLEKPEKGSILFEGLPVRQWLKNNKGKMSVVFQDYTASVNPRYTVTEAIAEPLCASGAEKDLDWHIEQLLVRVGLEPEVKNRYPHELSGGQLQRVCIARAIATKPRFIVLDEAISSLDVSVQAQILKLLHQLRVEMNITYLFVAHDLQAVAHLCDKIAFLYQGQIVEEVESGELARVNNHYARALLASVIPFEV
ncbi:MAG: peptide ABC transporter ATP-binding protein [Acetobacterium sp. MES1]|jgi:nickel transport system ATP-binding protein|uniref:ABC transporter ATP-binding protein n=1 Tax=Acetobacterium wieringae TaxID=52694 RepID=A0A5D0WSK6_9FIRM|nr:MULTISPECIES: dipeptide/oligopeptide/nickel ABC transporter ATP-binding protein [Acetobacterium]OXS26158.1 MAG: peptide ABC transporter ATP-binding protein [Acetobacterium sp. MES1]TYC87262.1 ABC transporter ATP-binding protein [Acetobacterium wieringae]